MSRLRGRVTHLIIAASMLFSFGFAALTPAVSYAESSNNSSQHKDTSKKKSNKKKKKAAKETTKTVTQTKTIPFTTEHQADPNYPSGQTHVIQDGQNGTKTLTYKVTYKNGKQTKKKLVSETVTVAMVPQIIGDGSYVPPTPTYDASSGATAQCVDGTYSYAAHHQGACSHHGGVATWYR